MRLISYLILLALLVGGAVWLADRPGAVAVDWLGWHLETSVPVLLGLLAVLAVALVLCVRLALAVWRLPTSMLEKRRHARRRALLLNQRADKAAGEEGGEASAANYARQALAADPSLAPAACRLAAALVAGGKLRRAASVVEKAWAREPLPELARAYAGLRPGEEPLQRLRRIEKLAAVHPHDVESHLAIAEAALDAKLWGQARKHLLAAVALRSSARPYHLLARLERAEYKNEDAARAWERKAHEAPGDPAWICADCGHVSNDWSLTCPQCDAVDSQGRGIPKPIVLPVPKVG